MSCGRCKQAATSEGCWWCGGDLCGLCWEAHGHCGHMEADLINARKPGGPLYPMHVLTPEEEELLKQMKAAKA